MTGQVGEGETPISYDTTPTETIDIDSIDLSTDDAIPQERSFLGVITHDQKEPGKYGPQWHFGVKPLSFQLNTETGSFHNWPAIKFSDKDGSLITQGEFGRVVTAVKNAFGSHKIGVGELNGLVGHFVLRKLTYGKNRETGEVIEGKRDSLIALRAATPDEIANAGIKPPAPTTYSPEDTATLVELMSGKKVAEYTRGLGRNNTINADLKNALMNGDAARILVGMGVGEVVDGVFQAKVTA